jgi:probable HAF family extracellular repeat protein/parallel beta-helix repeat protein
VDYEAFRWTASNGMIGLGDLSGGEYESRAYAVSADGLVVVGYSKSASGEQAFRWTESEGMLGLGYLSGELSQAYGISADGSVVVGRANSLEGAVAFRWTDSEGMVSLGDLPGGSVSGVAYDASTNGSIIVGMSNSVDDFEAFIWDEDNGIRNLQDLLIDNYHLDLTGWHLRCAYGISDDGLIIVGSGYNPQGQREGWIAVLTKLEPVIIYVDDNAAGANDGSTWTDAFNYLQDALTAAWSGDEIRVAQGIYKPDQGAVVTTGDREATFQLINSVTIKGGYAGADTPDPNARNIRLYQTILTGDLAGNDDPRYSQTTGENSYHVVTGSGTNEAAVLDGFYITAGYPHPNPGGGMYNLYGYPTIKNCTFRNNRPGIWNQSSSPTFTKCIIINNNGGIYNWQSSPTLIYCIFTENAEAGMCNWNGSNPTLTNCNFYANWKDIDGGGMNNIYSGPILVNCAFNGNVTHSGNGGGMCNYYSNPTLTNCTFRNNFAFWDGGGMSNYYSRPTLTNCIFNTNWADEYGGGIDNYYSDPTLTKCKFTGNWANCGGGAGISNWHSNSILSNCVFSGNTVGEKWGDAGGGMLTIAASNVVLTNCTFAVNTAPMGDALACHFWRPENPSNIEATNCIFWDGDNGIWNNDNSEINITYSDVQGGWQGKGNIDADPCFVELGYWDPLPDYNDDYWNRYIYWIEGDYHLLPGSPCIDTGDPNYVAGPNETDVDGKPRVIGGRIDMGAYEYRPTIPAEARILPRTINLASKGNWITCYIWLPEGYDVADIDPNSVLLEHQIKPEQFSVDQQKQVATAVFNRDKVQGILNVGDIELKITCQLTDGTYFEATDIVQVTDKAGKN